MANYISLVLFKGELSNTSATYALPTSGAGNMLIEQIQGTMTIGGTTILSRIVFSAFGLSRSNTVYYSASDVATLVTALGATLYKTFSVYRSLNSSAAVNVAFPVSGGIGVVLEPVAASPATTIAGVTIQSQFNVSSNGLNQGRRLFYSAATVATNIAVLG